MLAFAATLLAGDRNLAGGAFAAVPCMPFTRGMLVAANGG